VDKVLLQSPIAWLSVQLRVQHRNLTDFPFHLCIWITH